MSITQVDAGTQIKNLVFSRGGTVVSQTNPANIVVWQAPFACTVTNVRGLVSGAIGSTINARKNGSLKHLAADLTLSTLDTWLDGGAVQNVSYAQGDKMEIMITSVAGLPSQIAIQVDFTKP